MRVRYNPHVANFGQKLGIESGSSMAGPISLLQVKWPNSSARQCACQRLVPLRARTCSFSFKETHLRGMRSGHPSAGLHIDFGHSDGGACGTKTHECHNPPQTAQAHTSSWTMPGSRAPCKHQRIFTILCENGPPGLSTAWPSRRTRLPSGPHASADVWLLLHVGIHRPGPKYIRPLLVLRRSELLPLFILENH